MKLTLTRHTFESDYTAGKLFVNAEYFCDTLEPPSRNIHIDIRKINDVDHRLAVVNQVLSAKNRFGKGKVAIPTGAYIVKMSPSEKFKGMRPFLLSVPGFSGIMFHEGNTHNQTLGCILVGKATADKSRLINSRTALKRLLDIIKYAEKKGEKVMLSLS